MPEECPEEVKDVIMACRASNPADRPTAREVFHRLSTAINPNRPRPASSILSSSLWSGQNSFHGRPSWAPPEHADGEEHPSFMACIHENSPADVSIDPSLNNKAKDQDRLYQCSPSRQHQPWGSRATGRSSSGDSSNSHRAMSL